jgi:hypothetical protein
MLDRLDSDEASSYRLDLYNWKMEVKLRNE